jgi:probable rRNA maturation factor
LLDFTFANNLKKQTLGKSFFYNILKKAVLHAGLDKKHVGLSLNIVGETKIKALNQKYRGKNKTTDVLSFPLNTLNPAIDAKIENNGIIELGDIFICLPIAEIEAQKENKKLKKQLELLTVHGFLHLLGYDHQTLAQKKKMFSLQEKILLSIF